MTWERFEERKTHGCEGFVVTVVLTHSHSVPYLSFNKAVREQVLRDHSFCDLFIDRDRKRLGLRFLRQPTDLNSYKIASYKSPAQPCGASRVSMQKAFKAWGFWQNRYQRSFSRLLKNDPVQDLWWLDITPLFNGGKP